MEYIAQAKRRGEFTCLLTLAIKNAFYSVQRIDSPRLLEEFDLETRILGVIDGFFWFCSIILNDREHYFNAGILQASCLGPTLCLVVVNYVLR